MAAVENVVLVIADPKKMLFVVASILLAIGALLWWKKSANPKWLYAHLFFLLTPLVYLAVSINCSMSFMQGLLAICTLVLAKVLIYVIPPIMGVVFIIGAWIMPRAYKSIGRKLRLKEFSKLCKETKIQAELHVIDQAKPLAFSIGKSVFVSVGLFELLNKKEQEAVFLHELYHVKVNASWNKFSMWFAHLFSPLAQFSGSVLKSEERSADAFARHLQRTGKYVASAKRKVRVILTASQMTKRLLKK